MDDVEDVANTIVDKDNGIIVVNKVIDYVNVFNL